MFFSVSLLSVGQKWALIVGRVEETGDFLTFRVHAHDMTDRTRHIPGRYKPGFLQGRF